jgi:hypothetical protein
MPYQIFYVDFLGHVAGGKTIHAADDLGALKEAQRVAHDEGPLEVWDDTRLVACVKRNGVPPAGSF